MSDKVQKFFASDKEIHDVLASSKRRMTHGQLLELARDRGIFISEEASREDLVDYLATLPHDFFDVEGLLEQAGPSKRAERTTFIEFSGDVTSEDIADALLEYQEDFESHEDTTIHPPRPHAVTANVKYSEFDYSRTALLQRHEKDADLEFRIEEKRVTVRMPATDKGHEIVAAIIERIERKKKTVFQRDEISVADLSVENRTIFFMNLMRGIGNHRVEMVVNIKVSAGGAAQDLDEGDEEGEDAREELLGVVRSVALSGENLLASPHYQQLRDGGFFVTSMTWRAIQEAVPNDKISFEVSFDNQEEGTGFKYLVRYAQQKSDGDYSVNYKAVPPARKKELCGLIENAARKALEDIRATH